MGNELITVIVPVYNVGKYVGRCIESLLNQTYGNLEIILIDDGSADSSVAVCRYYASKDSRIVVMTKENSGPSDTRNMGMDAAHGSCICFVDSDDWVSPYYIANLYSALVRTGADVSMSWFENVVEGNAVRSPVTDHCSDLVVLDRPLCLEKLLYMDGIDTSACCRLYRKDVVSDVRFPSGRLYEDILFTMDVMAKAGSFAVMKNVDYYYFQRRSSIQYQNFSPRKMDIMLHMVQLREYVHVNYPDLDRAASCRYFNAACNMVFQIADRKHYRKEFDFLWKAIVDTRWTVLTDSRSRSKARLAALLSYFGYPLMKQVYRKTQMRG